jgi:hypothetical protein
MVIVEVDQPKLLRLHTRLKASCTAVFDMELAGGLRKKSA